MNHLDGFTIQEGPFKNGQLFDGTLSRSILNDKVELFWFHCLSKSYFDFNLYADTESSVIVLINMNEKNRVRFKNHNRVNVVSPFSSTIINCPKTINITLKFEPQFAYNFIIIKSKPSNLKCGSANILKRLSEQGYDLQSNFVKFGAPNLTVCETVKKLFKLDQAEPESRLIGLGYCNIIMGLLFKEKIANNTSHLKSNFRSNEIKQLELITEEIKTNPEQQFTLKDLCKKAGMSVSKLQAGFKEMHDCTVAIFIRNIRLAKSIEMLQQTDLNVSEIVYSVGLNSRSYFCRIFKEQFKCSPKSYQQRLRDKVPSH